jgi:hypothetical protein
MAIEDPMLLDHEHRLRRLEEARHTIENTLLAMIEIERQYGASSEQHAALIARIDQNLAEMTDKLNGLIGWAAGTVKRKAPKKRGGPTNGKHHKK